MIVAGIETATSVCSAAIVCDGHVLSEKTLDERNIHAEKILTLVDDALSDARITVANIDGVAVSIGPGSFTGLRIGLSIAKGMAYALEKPLVGVPTLRALAQRAVDAGEARSGVCVFAVLDARRDEVYCQRFSVSGTEVVPVWPERDMTVSDLLDEIGGAEAVITGDAQEKIISILQNRQRGRDQCIAFVHGPVSKCSASSVAQLGESLFSQGRRDEVAALEPLYIKEFFPKYPHPVHNL